ncbi:hypothetical protein [Nocardioides sp. zg-1228]|uniref:hypothetical protein n=1 Tax=Nocardioides sp. zg-1228 TaxID=2763008 RepID=UPI0016425280|nr:hypothetical protein [Nocardioides sp. zg-1228]MBC2933629.1 hypothetical protein [Nocardioides sp. zg-1228]QSF56250.1 hypothetical protein JX575_11255 [Nocardioides sp. zg-1228]
MTTEQAWLGAAVVVALVALAVALLAHRRARRAEARAESLAESLTASLSERAPAPHAEAGASAFVITGLDDPARGTAPHRGPEVDPPVARPIDGRLFTDLVVRETVVRAAGWSHGLRRAMSAESRNRIRFAVRQESRRAGRERRAEVKQAMREFRARERADARADLGEDVA